MRDTLQQAYNAMQMALKLKEQILPGEIPQGLSSADWDSIQSQLAVLKYKAHAGDDGSICSSNPAPLARHVMSIRIHNPGRSVFDLELLQYGFEFTTSEFVLHVNYRIVANPKSNPRNRPQKPYR